MKSTFTTSKFRIPIKTRKGWQRYAVAIAVVVSAGILHWILGSYTGSIPSSVLFYPAVLFSAWYGGLGPGLLAIGLSILSGAFFWDEQAGLVPWALFILVGIAICLATEDLRRSSSVHKELALELLEFQKKIRDILESIQGYFFSLDAEEKFIHINKNCEIFLKSSYKKFLSKSIWEAFPDWKNADFGTKLREALNARKGVQFEFLDPKNQLWYEAHISPSSEGVSIHLYDVTLRKQAKAERDKAEEKLRIANLNLEVRVEERTFELAAANRNLKNEIQERQKVEREVLEILQKEQQRFSTQLHDELCQKLTGIMMLVTVAAQRLEKKSLLEWGELKKIADLLNQSITDARDMARGLFPVELDANSLMFSLRGLAGRTESLYQIHCNFHCPQAILIEDNIIATHLYRIAQEAIQNAISHGEAKHIDMNLIRREQEILLTIQNDGKIFEPGTDDSPGIGLQIMQYRARILNATLDFKNLSEGTLFTCSVPYPENFISLAAH